MEYEFDIDCKLMGMCLNFEVTIEDRDTDTLKIVKVYKVLKDQMPWLYDELEGEELISAESIHYDDLKDLAEKKFEDEIAHDKYLQSIDNEF